MISSRFHDFNIFIVTVSLFEIDQLKKHIINIKIHKKSYERSTMYACAKDRAHIAASNWNECGKCAEKAKLRFILLPFKWVLNW